MATPSLSTPSTPTGKRPKIKSTHVSDMMHCFANYLFLP